MKSLLKFSAPVIALLLAGCWSSTTPLIMPKDFDKVPLKGNVTSGTHSSTAVRIRYNISYEGKVAVAIPENGESDKISQYRMSFDLLQKDIYLLQAADGSGTFKGYVIAKFDKFGNMATYKPACSAAETALPGVTKNSSNICMFPDYPTLLKAAKARAVEIAAGNGESYIENQYSPTERISGG